MSELTDYGFAWGPMLVERIAHDDRIGWVLVVRPRDAHEPSVQIRVSPAGRSWQVRTAGCEQRKGEE